MATLFSVPDTKCQDDYAVHLEGGELVFSVGL
jgi:hypothetical protein